MNQDSHSASNDDLLDRQVANARTELQQRLQPAGPDLTVLRRRSHRRRAVAATTVVLALLAVVAVVRSDDDSPPPGSDLASPAAPTEVRFARSAMARSTGDPSAIPAAVSGNTDFAMDLHQLLTDAGRNFIVSPHSVSTALAMTMAGTDGVTNAQLQEALHLQVPEPVFHESLNALDQALNQPREADGPNESADPLALRTVNSQWAQQGHPFLDEYLDLLAESYDSGMNLVDFENDAERSRLAINEWVEDATDGQIVELIPPGLIDDLTKLVLINTITFKASWAAPFDDAMPGTFYADGDTEVTVPMMAGGNGMRASGDGWESVAIPYVGGAHMVVVVPDEPNGFTLSAEVLDQATRAQSNGEVTLPKFAITSEIDLKKDLRELGIIDAFDAETADLSRIDGTRDLHVTDVVHQATIDVDEQGTTASAATAVVVGALSAGPPPLVVDRPFHFAIQDDATGAILFTGQVTDPRT